MRNHHTTTLFDPTDAADLPAAAPSQPTSQTADLAHIAADLHPLATAVAACTLDPGNARTGHDLEAIAASLRLYGQRTPLVSNVDKGALFTLEQQGVNTVNT